MRKLTSLILATSLALGATSVVHAASDNLTPPPAPQHRPMPPHGPDFFHGIKLSDAQKQQVREIMQQSHKQMKRPSVEQRRAAHDIVATDNFDRNKAEALAAEMTAGAKDRMLQRMETDNKLYNVLTAEQKKQYNADFERHLTEKPGHRGNASAPKAD
ncbi:ATP-independent periplasmic protein-refolding chaperone Spy [Tatumella saanichensis]|uniref:ATP-independent periplasmic protein-refolding chaperone Spy n=1 Tax=Tatumella saanichensis TaxID=480813 RepID=UPI0004A2B308|nr:ATP-independent periplasmic protein-refolding chaperone Spy [Tatumella saanichensis]